MVSYFGKSKTNSEELDNSSFLNNNQSKLIRVRNNIQITSASLVFEKTLKIKKEAPTSKSRGALPYANNILQSNNNVNSNILSTKYSIQESLEKQTTIKINKKPLKVVI